MSTRRVLKAAEAVRESVSWAILAELHDPRVKNVTVTRVEMSGDLRQAKVYVSIMGDEKVQALSLRGLKSSTGFLQSKLSDRINTRYTPKIEFVLDKGVKNAIEITRILKEEFGDEEAVAVEEEAAEAATDMDDQEMPTDGADGEDATS
ncbi:MAG: 30S ribosome-binding factor RbfA [Planctomycetia bacterium]|jgi:ribosome-binding factor A